MSIGRAGHGVNGLLLRFFKSGLRFKEGDKKGWPTFQGKIAMADLVNLPLTPTLTSANFRMSCSDFVPKFANSHRSQSTLPTSEELDEEDSLEYIWRSGIQVGQVSADQFAQLSSDYTQKLISQKTLDKFRAKLTKSRDGLVFPRFAHTGDYVAQEPTSIRIVKFDQSVDPVVLNPSSPALFGYNTISSKNDVVVLVLTEWEAMFVHQHSGLPTIAFPDEPEQFDTKVLDLMAAFRKIIVWFPPGLIERAKAYMSLLGPERSYYISPSLLKGLSIKEYYSKPSKRSLAVLECLAQCLRMFHPCISSVNDLRTTVFDYVYHQGICQGIAKWNRFGLLNAYLGGLRLGELTVFSGPTGSGKTTFISLYSLDLCEQVDKQARVNTLWCSFEVGTARLVHVMLQQLNCRKIDETLPRDEMTAMYDRLATLPLHFTRFNGSFEFRDVIKAIEHHIEICDIRHVIVDNLQFLVGAVEQQSSDRFQVQDRVFSEFRRIATEKNVHLTLVIHPRKELDGGQLTINSLYGGVKASQEADNVYILQVRQTIEPCGTPKINRYFQILKNRRMGELEIGNRLELKFNHETLSHRIVKHIDAAFVKKTARTKN